jgi:hypothetical protein
VFAVTENSDFITLFEKKSTKKGTSKSDFQSRKLTPLGVPRRSRLEKGHLKKQSLIA